MTMFENGGRRPTVLDSVPFGQTLPPGWTLARLRDVSTLTNGFPFDSERFSRTLGFPLIRIRDLLPGYTETYYDGPIPGEAITHNDDILVGMDGDFNVVRWTGGTALLNQRLCRIRPNRRIVATFLYHVLPVALRTINDLTYFTTVKHLSSPDILRIRVPLPPLSEQRAIADYLDRETARIDALVAKKRRLIELLEEHRGSITNRLVLRGLSRSAAMQDSGVPWIGSVPSHWHVRRLKQVARLESGHTPSRQHPEYWVDCTIPWVSLADVHQFRDDTIEYITDTGEYVSELGLANSSARLLPTGTVIVSRTASVGFSCILGRDMATTQDFADWICGPMLRPEYLLYVFRSMRGEFQRLTMGSTHKTIYMPDIARFTVPVPPLKEQDAIVERVRSVLTNYRAVSGRARLQIDRLTEYRQALIAAAVTGQIDVSQVTA